MEKIKNMVINFLLKKYALGWLVKGYRAASGWRTVAAGVLAAAVFVGQVLGYIPENLADELYKIIGSIATVTFLEKMRKYQKAAESVVGMVKEEAAKQGVPADGVPPVAPTVSEKDL